MYNIDKREWIKRWILTELFPEIRELFLIKIDIIELK